MIGYFGGRVSSKKVVSKKKSAPRKPCATGWTSYMKNNKSRCRRLSTKQRMLKAARANNFFSSVNFSTSPPRSSFEQMIKARKSGLKRPISSFEQSIRARKSSLKHIGGGKYFF